MGLQPSLLGQQLPRFIPELGDVRKELEEKEQQEQHSGITTEKVIKVVAIGIGVAAVGFGLYQIGSWLYDQWDISGGENCLMVQIFPLCQSLK